MWIQAQTHQSRQPGTSGHRMRPKTIHLNGIPIACHPRKAETAEPARFWETAHASLSGALGPTVRLQKRLYIILHNLDEVQYFGETRNVVESASIWIRPSRCSGSRFALRQKVQDRVYGRKMDVM